MKAKLYDLMNWARIDGVVYSEEDKPCTILGPQVVGSSTLFQAFFPDAKKVTLVLEDKNKRVSMEGFAIMDKYLSNKIGCICDEILSGNIEISPTKKGDRVPCDYCNYNSICRFDCADTKNNYTYYKSKNIYEEIIKEMEEAIGVDRKSTESN